MGLHIFCFAWKQNCEFLPFSFPDSLFKLTFFLAKILSACYMVTTIKLYKTLWSLFMNGVMEFTNLKAVEVLQGKCLLSIIKSPKVLDNYLFILGRTKSESSQSYLVVLNLGPLHCSKSSALTTTLFLITHKEIRDFTEGEQILQ